MTRNIILLIIALILSKASIEQTQTTQTLFILDSVPVIDDPEPWNPIVPADIADMRVIKNADSLKLLGFEELASVTYVFTKEYRKRPDSVKRIASLRQMQMKDGRWNLNDVVYSGKYIDYYNSGRIQDEGTLFNGKLNGELKVYYLNGNLKSLDNYKDGIPNGSKILYYKNGAMMQKAEYTEGRNTGRWETYFLNGQLQTQMHPKKGNRFDSVFTYYSTGKVKRIALIYNGAPVVNNKIDKLNYLDFEFNQSLNKGDLMGANKVWAKLYDLDSTNADTYFKLGIILYREYRFDKAITEFGKALEVEPLLKEALLHRALSRIKKYQFAHEQDLTREKMAAIFSSDEVVPIPADEQEKICNDLREADILEFYETPFRKIISTEMMNYCMKFNNRN
jgi:tetratricopeptide (TPR) repeat protein